LAGDKRDISAIDKFGPIFANQKENRPNCTGSLRFVTNTSDCHGPLRIIKTELGLIQHTPNSENELTMNRLNLRSDRKFGMMRLRISPIADIMSAIGLSRNCIIPIMSAVILRMTDVHPTCHQNFENTIGTLNPN